MNLARWEAGVRIACSFLDIWIHHYQEVIDPVLLLDGEEIKKTFNLEEGLLIGKIKTELKFAQAVGKVKTKLEAIEFVQLWLNSFRGNQNECS